MIPYRVKERINSLRTKWYLGKAIEAFSPLRVASKDLSAEVHMMLGRNHLWRALAALHSFFHHSGLSDRVGLMLHLDGTVTARQRRWLEERIRGVQFTDYPSDDQRLHAVFQERPYCKSYYKRGISCMPKLFHIPVFFRLTRRLTATGA